MIQFNSLSFSYTQKNQLFNQLDLNILPGKIHGLLGKNGSGKTTLLKLICGLVTPCSGEIITGGFVPSKRKPEMLSDIFLLPEEIFLPASTAEKLVNLYAPFYPRFDKAQFLNLLEQWEVDYQRPLNKQSLGQNKKTMIAFALACNTTYLLLDEPTNGLDIPSKVVFRRLIASVFNENRTIIISTHQVRDLDTLIDSLLLLHEGKIQVQSSIEQIAEKFQFVHSSGQPEGEILFSFKSILGNSYMLANAHGMPGQVDLETFFNAVIDNPCKFNFLVPLSKN